MKDNIEHGWLVGRYGGHYEKEPICHCEWCENEIYDEEDCFVIGGCVVCRDCKEKRDLENEEVWAVE